MSPPVANSDSPATDSMPRSRRDPLVGEGGSGEPVAHDVSAGREGGLDHRSDVFGTGRSHEERFGARRDLERRVEDDLSHPLPDHGSAGLAGEHCIKTFGEERCLGCLARRLTSLEDDEATSGHSGPSGPTGERIA